MKINSSVRKHHSRKVMTTEEDSGPAKKVTAERRRLTDNQDQVQIVEMDGTVQKQSFPNKCDSKLRHGVPKVILRDILAHPKSKVEESQSYYETVNEGSGRRIKIFLKSGDGGDDMVPIGWLDDRKGIVTSNKSKRRKSFSKVEDRKSDDERIPSAKSRSLKSKSETANLKSMIIGDESSKTTKIKIFRDKSGSASSSASPVIEPVPVPSHSQSPPIIQLDSDSETDTIAMPMQVEDKVEESVEVESGQEPLPSLRQSFFAEDLEGMDLNINEEDDDFIYRVMGLPGSKTSEEKAIRDKPENSEDLASEGSSEEMSLLSYANALKSFLGDDESSDEDGDEELQQSVSLPPSKSQSQDLEAMEIEAESDSMEATCSGSPISMELEMESELTEESKASTTPPPPPVMEFTDDDSSMESEEETPFQMADISSPIELNRNVFNSILEGLESPIPSPEPEEPMSPTPLDSPDEAVNASPIELNKDEAESKELEDSQPPKLFTQSENETRKCTEPSSEDLEEPKSPSPPQLVAIAVEAVVSSLINLTENRVDLKDIQPPILIPESEIVSKTERDSPSENMNSDELISQSKHIKAVISSPASESDSESEESEVSENESRSETCEQKLKIPSSSSPVTDILLGAQLSKPVTPTEDEVESKAAEFQPLMSTPEPAVSSPVRPSEVEGESELEEMQTPMSTSQSAKDSDTEPEIPVSDIPMETINSHPIKPTESKVHPEPESDDIQPATAVPTPTRESETAVQNLNQPRSPLELDDIPLEPAVTSPLRPLENKEDSKSEPATPVPNPTPESKAAVENLEELKSPSKLDDIPVEPVVPSPLRPIENKDDDDLESEPATPVPTPESKTVPENLEEPKSPSKCDIIPVETTGSSPVPAAPEKDDDTESDQIETSMSTSTSDLESESESDIEAEPSMEMTEAPESHVAVADIPVVVQTTVSSPVRLVEDKEESEPEDSKAPSPVPTSESETMEENLEESTSSSSLSSKLDDIPVEVEAAVSSPGKPTQDEVDSDSEEMQTPESVNESDAEPEPEVPVVDSDIPVESKLPDPTEPMEMQVEPESEDFLPTTTTPVPAAEAETTVEIPKEPISPHMHETVSSPGRPPDDEVESELEEMQTPVSSPESVNESDAESEEPEAEADISMETEISSRTEPIEDKVDSVLEDIQPPSPVTVPELENESDIETEVPLLPVAHVPVEVETRLLQDPSEDQVHSDCEDIQPPSQVPSPALEIIEDSEDEPLFSPAKVAALISSPVEVHKEEEVHSIFDGLERTTPSPDTEKPVTVTSSSLDVIPVDPEAEAVISRPVKPTVNKSDSESENCQPRTPISSTDSKAVVEIDLSMRWMKASCKDVGQRSPASYSGYSTPQDVLKESPPTSIAQNIQKESDCSTLKEMEKEKDAIAISEKPIEEEPSKPESFSLAQAEAMLLGEDSSPESSNQITLNYVSDEQEEEPLASSKINLADALSSPKSSSQITLNYHAEEPEEQPLVSRKPVEEIDLTSQQGTFGSDPGFTEAREPVQPADILGDIMIMANENLENCHSAHITATATSEPTVMKGPLEFPEKENLTCTSADIGSIATTNSYSSNSRAEEAVNSLPTDTDILVLSVPSVPVPMEEVEVTTPEDEIVILKEVSVTTTTTPMEHSKSKPAINTEDFTSTDNISASSKSTYPITITEIFEDELKRSKISTAQVQSQLVESERTSSTSCIVQVEANTKSGKSPEKGLRCDIITPDHKRVSLPENTFRSSIIAPDPAEYMLSIVPIPVPKPVETLITPAKRKYYPSNDDSEGLMRIKHSTCPQCQMGYKDQALMDEHIVGYHCDTLFAEAKHPSLTGHQFKLALERFFDHYVSKGYCPPCKFHVPVNEKFILRKHFVKDHFEEVRRNLITYQEEWLPYLQMTEDPNVYMERSFELIMEGSMASASFVCSICGLSIRRSSRLYHLRTHGFDIVKCAYCNDLCGGDADRIGHELMEHCELLFQKENIHNLSKDVWTRMVHHVLDTILDMDSDKTNKCPLCTSPASKEEQEVQNWREHMVSMHFNYVSERILASQKNPQPPAAPAPPVEVINLPRKRPSIDDICTEDTNTSCWSLISSGTDTEVVPSSTPPSPSKRSTDEIAAAMALASCFGNIYKGSRPPSAASSRSNTPKQQQLPPQREDTSSISSSGNLAGGIPQQQLRHLEKGASAPLNFIHIPATVTAISTKANSGSAVAGVEACPNPTSGNIRRHPLPRQDSSNSSSSTSSSLGSTFPGMSINRNYRQFSTAFTITPVNSLSPVEQCPPSGGGVTSRNITPQQHQQQPKGDEMSGVTPSGIISAALNFSRILADPMTSTNSSASVVACPPSVVSVSKSNAQYQHMLQRQYQYAPVTSTAPSLPGNISTGRGHFSHSHIPTTIPTTTTSTNSSSSLEARHPLVVSRSSVPHIPQRQDTASYSSASKSILNLSHIPPATIATATTCISANSSSSFEARQPQPLVVSRGSIPPISQRQDTGNISAAQSVLNIRHFPTTISTTSDNSYSLTVAYPRPTPTATVVSRSHTLHYHQNQRQDTSSSSASPHFGNISAQTKSAIANYSHRPIPAAISTTDSNRTMKPSFNGNPISRLQATRSTNFNNSEMNNTPKGIGGMSITVACKYCHFTFPNLNLLDDHVIGSHCNILFSSCQHPSLNPFQFELALDRFFSQCIDSNKPTCQFCNIRASKNERFKLRKHLVIDHFEQLKTALVAFQQECYFQLQKIHSPADTLKQSFTPDPNDLQYCICNICGKQIVDKYNCRMNHLRSMHGYEMLKCHFCEETFGMSDSRNRHELRVHCHLLFQKENTNNLSKNQFIEVVYQTLDELLGFHEDTPKKNRCPLCPTYTLTERFEISRSKWRVHMVTMHFKFVCDKIIAFQLKMRGNMGQGQGKAVDFFKKYANVNAQPQPEPAAVTIFSIDKDKMEGRKFTTVKCHDCDGKFTYPELTEHQRSGACRLHSASSTPISPSQVAPQVPVAHQVYSSVVPLPPNVPCPSVQTSSYKPKRKFYYLNSSISPDQIDQKRMKFGVPITASNSTAGGVPVIVTSPTTTSSVAATIPSHSQEHQSRGGVICYGNATQTVNRTANGGVGEPILKNRVQESGRRKAYEEKGPRMQSSYSIDSILSKRN